MLLKEGGDNLTYREARERAGLTMADAANALGVTKAAISVWENGKNNPLLENLRKMAQLYGVSISQLEEASGEQRKE